MHIKIETEARRGLRIIEEIPDLPLGKISGYNGIGKTNAIKLLRLCTGEQPFRGDAASWRSFKSQLVGGRVEVSGLRDGMTIEWQLSPERWPDAPVPPEHLLGTVRVDGSPGGYRDVPAIFQVHHIVVAETPLKVLQDRVSSARRTVTNWVSQVGVPRRDEIERALGSVQKLILRSLPAQLLVDLNAANEAARVAAEKSELLSDTRARAETLDRAVEVTDRLDQVRGRGPEMDANLRDIRAALESVDEDKRELDQQIAEAGSKKHQNEQAELEFQKAQKHLIRQEKALRGATDSLSRLAAAADVEPNRLSIAEQRKVLGQQLSKLSELLPQVNATPMLIATLEDLAQRLEDVERHDLGDAVLIEESEHRSGWTISELREACSQQARKLAQSTPSFDAQRLQHEIDSIRERLDALAEAATVIEEVDSLQESFNRAANRLRVASDRLPEQTARTLEELIRVRNEKDAESRALQDRLTRLEHARELLFGGMTEDALAAELVRLCREAGVSAARVRGRREQVRAALEEVNRKYAQATQNAERAQRTADDRARDVSKIATDLAAEEEYSWLRNAVPSTSGLLGLEVVEQAQALERLVPTLESARESVRRNVTSLQGLGIAFTRLGDALQDSSDRDDDPNEWDEAARLWLASDVRHWFNEDLIRQSLFNNATDVRLDANDMTVYWTADGEDMSRPLSGFSSGQQAFAYTHAQLAQLERDAGSAVNRLVALDEFGSFLDADRMEDLRHYLTEYQARMPSDQVVVILPLESSPASGRENGPERVARIRALEQRGYIAEAFNL